MDSFVIIVKLMSFLMIVFSNYFFNYFNDESIECPNGYFRLKGMKSCNQLLDCSDYNDMTAIVLLNRGLVKKVYLYEWNGYYIAVSKLSDQKYVNDFMQNINHLRQLSPNAFTVQLIGWCNNDMVFTEYHPFGDANQLPMIFNQMPEFNNFSFKFNLCVNYLKIIDYLHNSPIGVRVMCDSNTIEKTLSQLLVTNHMSLILNDLDALPEVTDIENVKCGSKQLFGSFVAPEQLWDREDQPFNDEIMKGYDHKTDIWKIPDVCHWFLSLGSNHSDTNYSNYLIESQLKDIHFQCKNIDPQKRPSTQEILSVYNNIQLIINN